MTTYQALQKFYKENNFPIDGGESDAYFNLKFQFFTLKLPNFKFRKEVIYIHDIQHILNNCDTTWKGEAFIAGWEIGTKMWKHIPIGFISLWAMGFSLLNHPKQLLKGYKTGINTKNILDLQLKKDTLLQLPISDLKTALQKEHATPMNWLVFLFWCFTSLIVFLFPLLLIITCIILL
ncbi:hypothetical protein [uncultured Polaribacter sp.]|uniref:hypothetical protein n=1 Tax=uncultured Polaribacter sp. TaxID=174711 RepID=UPI002607FFFB|nr:hypothetical protein [uncultured Polaribacter sp.]